MAKRIPSLSRALATAVDKGLTVVEVRTNPDGTWAILTGKPKEPEVPLSPAERWALEHGHSAA